MPVCYHETVLHELIGNSATTNLVFIEVPRTLFHPHKSFFDSLGNDRVFLDLTKLWSLMKQEITDLDIPIAIKGKRVFTELKKTT